ncbi:MAG: DUF2130 domain-containing protein [Ferruginibacter sp.]
MATEIKCPNCGHEFELNESLKNEVEKELRGKMVDWQKKKEDEFAAELRKKEADFNTVLATEKKQLQQSLEENLRKTITTDFENRLKMQEQINSDNEEKLKSARQKELEFLKMEQALKTREAELEINAQKKMQEERVKLTEEIRKIEFQKNELKDTAIQLKMRELEKQLEDQKRLAEEMRRKAEQGSMQLQGEVQELALEEMLIAAFPFDLISEVGKGIRGADCIQTVRNNVAQECGRIIYESKRTKNFDKSWIDKLKADMRSTTSDVAVLVTNTLPENHNKFSLIDGVWVCSFEEVAALVHVLRDGILNLFKANSKHENKGDKINMLYSYLTSNEFSEQWNAIREGFMSMKISIQRERDAMEKLWKAREKQLEKVLLNAAHIKGSVEGIAGQDSINFNLIENAGDADE